MGIICIPSGFITVLIGSSRYIKMDKAISVVRRKFGKKPPKDKSSAKPAMQDVGDI